MPYFSGYMSASYWCGVAHTHTVCDGAPVGEYLIALVLMPAGENLNIEKAFDLDSDTVALVKSKERNATTD